MRRPICQRLHKSFPSPAVEPGHTHRWLVHSDVKSIRLWAGSAKPLNTARLLAKLADLQALLPHADLPT